MQQRGKGGRTVGGGGAVWKRGERIESGLCAACESVVKVLGLRCEGVVEAALWTQRHVQFPNFCTLRTGARTAAAQRAATKRAPRPERYGVTCPMVDEGGVVGVCEMRLRA